MQAQTLPKWIFVAASLIGGLVAISISVYLTLKGSSSCSGGYGVIGLAVIIPLLFCLGTSESESEL